ncbi:MAG: hypothetical protein A3D92_18970 [Bacteroidetes bacterium RIFCSPHIGHO2_02_FULL_44_7]|nr:MAG: hypothetical protein A3D92_18970 [Bacteroidetes bacterium RIFCSPHIGHO2_02_FULL_44_7]
MAHKPRVCGLFLCLVTFPCSYIPLETRKLETMAGAKETPRQRMIGMMYLVLTALLALNVSKSILDAFVAIEENIQKANLTELFRGDERKAQLIEIAIDKSNPNRARKAKLLQEVIADIDRMTAEQIQLMDALKLEILNACGEDTKTIDPELGILMERYDVKRNALKPIRMNLERVQGQDKYDEVMHILIGDDIRSPQGRGMQLWKSMLGFRKELTEKIASTQLGTDGEQGFDRSYYFKAPMINSFSSQLDLDKTIRKSMANSKVHPEDEAMILEIYKSLSKEEYSTVHDVEKVHWIGKTFDHAPVVAALASLSSLQKDVLSARANALTLIRSRVAGDDYSFNKILAIANGPEIVNEGDEFALDVMMVAYDSDKQPKVTLNGTSVEEVKDGQGHLQLRAQGSQMDLQGTITVRNKSGLEKTIPWTKTVRVMKPSGSIELPELNVLYRGYNNLVRVVASGFESAELNATGATYTKVGDGYHVVPSGSGRTAQLAVLGRSTDGKTVVLRRTDFRVLNLPDPTLYWGGSKSGGNIPTGDFKLFMKYGPEVPLNASFSVVRWEMACGERPVTGNGNDVSSARQFILAIPKGRLISVSTWVRGPDNITRKISGVFTK